MANVNSTCPRRDKSIVPIRWVVASMALLGPLVCYMSRQNLNFTIFAMVPCKTNNSFLYNSARAEALTATATTSPAIRSYTNDTEKSNDNPTVALKHLNINSTIPTSGFCPTTHGPKYNWTESERNWVIGAFFWPYVLAQIPSGRMSETIGPRWVLLMTTVGTAAMSLLSPLAASLGSTPFFCVRFMLGAFQAACYPAGYNVCTRWLPPSERRIALPILYVSAYIGAIIASYTTGYFVSQPNLGWEWAFYLPGIVSALWALVWYLVASDGPSEHKLISQAELDYIGSGAELMKSSMKPKLSWMKAFSSKQVIMTILVRFGTEWSSIVTMEFIPSYLNYIVGVDATENSSINSNIYMIFCAGAIFVGYTSAKMVAMKDKLGLSLIQIRKLYQAVSIFGQTICFFWITQIGTDQQMAKMVLYLQILAFSFVNGCECHLAYEISYQFAGSIFAISNAIAFTTGFIIPTAKSFIVLDSYDKSSWDQFFYLGSIVSLAAGGTFLIAGGNEPEDFTKDDQVPAIS